MNKKLQFRLIAFDSEAYVNTLKLRHEILRAPLGLKFSEEDLKKEFADFHLAGFYGSRLAACMVLSPYNESTIKMRQVAVEATLQGNGVGKQLVLEAEKICTGKRFQRIVLNARDAVVPFYEKLGYKSISDVFMEVGIPHVTMEKNL